jgi:hypothetical protein
MHLLPSSSFCDEKYSNIFSSVANSRKRFSYLKNCLLRAVSMLPDILQYDVGANARLATAIDDASAAQGLHRDPSYLEPCPEGQRGQQMVASNSEQRHDETRQKHTSQELVAPTSK